MYTIAQIQNVIAGEWFFSNKESQFELILQDSRKLVDAKKTLFFAINGERLNGHNYLQEMYNNGVRNFVVQEDELVKTFSNANYVLVENSLSAIQKLTSFHRSQFKLPVVAITGSNGKTIVKEWCHQILQEEYTICRSPKSYNSQIGVPLSVWGLNESHNLALFEAGISEPGEMENLEKIIQASIGIFTTISSAHSENFINEGHKIKEKLKLFLKSDILIYCTDINTLHQNIRSVFANVNQLNKVPILLSWGKHEDAAVKILEQEEKQNSTTFNLLFEEKKIVIEIPFTDYSSLQNAMHCVVLLLHLKKNESFINQRLQKLQRVAMRLEQKNGINQTIIINDSYNSDIDSLKIALDFLQQQRQQKNKTLILSDILQSGLSGVDLYTAVNDLLVKNQINRFIAIGENLKQHKFIFHADNFERGISFFDKSEDFLQHFSDEDFNNEIILLKGARKFAFEKISSALEEKAHTTVLEIDLKAVILNLNVFSSKLNPNTKIMAMVKAFSYGASSVEIAKLLEFNRVDYFGVAYADEGVTLRKAGVKTPILVLNPEERSFAAIIKFNLEPEIYSLDLLRNFTEALKNSSYPDKYPIHIDLDTGMKRLGFEKEELEAVIKELKNSSSIEVKSIFSHLAASDEESLDSFTEKQITLFDQWSQQIITGIGYKPMRHLSNSSGIARFPSANFDMVRLGIGMYGFSENLQEELATVTYLKTKISQIKQVKKGESIGYGRKGTAEQDLTIATVAIGYADGLNRLLSNGVGEVFVAGKRAPIIGNVCMDMAMIDVSGISGVEFGTNVEVFGDNISVQELAEKCQTIPYEILTSISERVKRVFFVEK